MGNTRELTVQRRVTDLVAIRGRPRCALVADTCLNANAWPSDHQ